MPGSSSSSERLLNVGWWVQCASLLKLLLQLRCVELCVFFCFFSICENSEPFVRMFPDFCQVHCRVASRKHILGTPLPIYSTPSNSTYTHPKLFFWSVCLCHTSAHSQEGRVRFMKRLALAWFRHVLHSYPFVVSLWMLFSSVVPSKETKETGKETELKSPACV